MGSFSRIDNYTRAMRVFWNLNRSAPLYFATNLLLTQAIRWVGIRTDILAGLFTASLGAYLLYGGGVSPSQTGFSLNMAGSFHSLELSALG